MGMQFEYAVSELVPASGSLHVREEQQEILRQYGGAGWELVSVIPIKEGRGQFVRFYFKREWDGDAGEDF